MLGLGAYDFAAARMFYGDVASRLQGRRATTRPRRAAIGAARARSTTSAASSACSRHSASDPTDSVHADPLLAAPDKNYDLI